jgi:hypothetical protein
LNNWATAGVNNSINLNSTNNNIAGNAQDIGGNFNDEDDDNDGGYYGGGDDYDDDGYNNGNNDGNPSSSTTATATAKANANTNGAARLVAAGKGCFLTLFIIIIISTYHLL